jgi:hypothetical protein
MKPVPYINWIKRLLTLVCGFTLCFMISCTNDDTDNEGDLDIITPTDKNGIHSDYESKIGDTLSNN